MVYFGAVFVDRVDAISGHEGVSLGYVLNVWRLFFLDCFAVLWESYLVRECVSFCS